MNADRMAMLRVQDHGAEGLDDPPYDYAAAEAEDILSALEPLLAERIVIARYYREFEAIWDAHVADRYDP